MNLRNLVKQFVGSRNGSQGKRRKRNEGQKAGTMAKKAIRRVLK